VGVEAIHATRRYNYVGALSKAIDAFQYLARCRELAPDFPDLVLADGINNYWRSVVALNTKLIPDGEDRRAEGISQMKYVETHGIFVAAPTTLALTFTYLEERDIKRALGTASRAHLMYPDNVINNLVLARIYIYTRRFKQSEAICMEILEDAPDNERVHYYLGLIYSRTKRMDQAIAEMERYLGYDLIDEYRATTQYRLGGFHYRKKEYAKAEDYYQQAVKTDKHKGAKKRLERMKRLKKEGIISY
jgi:tetratricopeptide (TPR) repeat protein